MKINDLEGSFRGLDEKWMREEYALDWPQCKVFLRLLRYPYRHSQHVQRSNVIPWCAMLRSPMRRQVGALRLSSFWRASQSHQPAGFRQSVVARRCWNVVWLLK